MGRNVMGAALYVISPVEAAESHPCAGGTVAHALNWSEV